MSFTYEELSLWMARHVGKVTCVQHTKGKYQGLWVATCNTDGCVEVRTGSSQRAAIEELYRHSSREV